MNREQRRAAGLKGKRLKKIREREFETSLRAYLYLVGALWRAVYDEAIYESLRSDIDLLNQSL